MWPLTTCHQPSCAPEGQRRWCQVKLQALLLPGGDGGGGLVTKSCLTLVTPWTIAHQAPVHGISQERILE